MVGGGEAAESVQLGGGSTVRHPVQLKAPAFLPLGYRDGLQVGVDAPGGEGDVQGGAEHANLGRSRARSVLLRVLHVLLFKAFKQGQRLSSAALCVLSLLVGSVRRQHLRHTHTQQRRREIRAQDGGSISQVLDVPAHQGIRMHPPAEQFGGGERGVALPALQHTEGVLESGAEERGVAGVHGMQVRHRTGVFLRGHLRRLRALTQLPGGGKNRQMHAHVEPFQTPVVQLFQADRNKLFEQLGTLRGAVGAKQVGGEQFQLQLASGVRFGLVCFVESVGGGAGRDLMVQERAGAFLHVRRGNGAHGGVPVPVDYGAGGGERLRGGGLNVTSFSEGGACIAVPPTIPRLALPAVSLFEERRTVFLNLRQHKRIQLESVVAVEFTGTLSEHDSVGARVLSGTRLHPFFKVFEGGCLHLRVGVAERHDYRIFAGGSVEGALPVQRLEHGQNFERVRFGSGAHGGCRVGEGGGIQRLRVFAPEAVNMLHAEGYARADG